MLQVQVFLVLSIHIDKHLIITSVTLHIFDMFHCSGLQLGHVWRCETEEHLNHLFTNLNKGKKKTNKKTTFSVIGITADSCKV